MEFFVALEYAQKKKIVRICDAREADKLSLRSRPKQTIAVRLCARPLVVNASECRAQRHRAATNRAEIHPVK
jgi:hypothetical protein